MVKMVKMVDCSAAKNLKNLPATKDQLLTEIRLISLSVQPKASVEQYHRQHRQRPQTSYLPSVVHIDRSDPLLIVARAQSIIFPGNVQYRTASHLR